MTRTDCPLCGTRATFTLKGTHTDAGVRYDLYECSECTGQFFEPLKNPGASWYEHDERYAGRNESPILEPQWNHTQAIDYFGSKTGTVLDVGCGVGNFLAYAESKGWKGVGIDFDHDAIEAGKKTFGLTELSVADIHQFRNSNSGKQFNLVTFFDVLEHIDDHKEFMEDVRALVATGGHIAMSMPHRAHAAFLMPADAPPRHLTRWDEKSLKVFLNRFGFDVVHMKSKGEGIRFIILKLRFKYGRSLSMGLVNKVSGPVGKKTEQMKLRIALAKGLALVKDTLIFGIPALLIWLALLPTRKRYVSLFAIARLREAANGQAKKRV